MQRRSKGRAVSNAYPTLAAQGSVAGYIRQVAGLNIPAKLFSETHITRAGIDWLSMLNFGSRPTHQGRTSHVEHPRTAPVPKGAQLRCHGPFKREQQKEQLNVGKVKPRRP